MRLILRGLVIFLGLVLAVPAVAGPPYITDDPDPTDTGHYEIYAFNDFVAGHGDAAGSTGLDLNFGPIPGVQLTATLPLEWTSSARPRLARGDVEVGVKTRLIHDQKSGFSLSLFPRAFLPTGLGSKRASLLLPVWGGIEAGPWKLFGGGGFHWRGGAGARSSWVEGLAVTRAVSKRATIGFELAHESADAVDGEGAATFDAGAIIGLGGLFSLLLAGGPQRGDRSHRVDAHLYTALGLNF